MTTPRLTWQRQPLRLRHRFATSRGGVSEKQTLVVRLEHENIVGWGEAVPSPLYGQSLEATEAVLADISVRLGDDLFRVETILADCIRRPRCAAGRDRGRGQCAARLDRAELSQPVWRMLGLDRPCVTTTFTLGVADAAEMRTKLDEALAAGFTALKVKIGAAHDHETLSLIRERFDGPLFLDANEAWSASQALEWIPQLAQYRPMLIEQPLPRDQWHQLVRLRELGVAPIYVDESCERPGDVLRLAGHVDGIVVKFTKCGGIREALRMFSVARMLGVRVMLGCFCFEQPGHRTGVGDCFTGGCV